MAGTGYQTSYYMQYSTKLFIIFISHKNILFYNFPTSYSFIKLNIFIQTSPVSEVTVSFSALAFLVASIARQCQDP